VILSHKRRTKLLSSIPYAYSGFFSITSGILLAASLLYIVFFPGIALGVQWLNYNTPDFFIRYPDILVVNQVPNGVQFIQPTELGSEMPSFAFLVSVQPYNGPSQLTSIRNLANPNELSSEMANNIVQQNPNAQIINVGPNDAGNLVTVEFIEGNFHSVMIGTIHDGKLYRYGYTIAMGPNDAIYNQIGINIANTMLPKMTSMSAGGMAGVQGIIDRWAINNPGSAEYCQLHQFDDDPSC
jgi:hypothetical protein